MPGYDNRESNLTIVNRALSYLNAHPIQADEWNSERDNSKACKEAKKHFSMCLRMCLSLHNWTFARKREKLQKDLIDNPDYNERDPDSPIEIPYPPSLDWYPEYTYRFSYPRDFVSKRAFRYNDGSIICLTKQDSANYIIGTETKRKVTIEGGHIYSMIDDVICEYTFYQDNIDALSGPFIEAFCCRLAAELGKELTGSEGITNNLWSRAAQELFNAKNLDALENGPRFIS